MKKMSKKQLRRKSSSGWVVKRAGSGAPTAFRTKAKAEQEARTLAGMVKDDIALYLSPLTAVAGEFRRRLRGA